MLSTIFLGVTINNILYWVENFKQVKCKISKGIGIIKKSKRTLTISCLVTLYYSILFTYLACAEVGIAFDSYFTSIVKFQKKNSKNARLS